MKRSVLFHILATVFALTTFASAQEWSYTQQLHFPEEDSNVVRPFLCDLDANGRLYVISSKATDASAHNAVYYLDPGDTVFTKFIDYDLNGDSDTLTGNVGALRGVACQGDDIILSVTQPYPKTKPNTLSAMYYYHDADTTMVEQYGWDFPTGAGYGSFNHGIDVTSDSTVIAGISFGTSVRFFNFGSDNVVAARGSWIPPFPENPAISSNAMEPGGPENAGRDLIRDVAVLSAGDYSDSTTKFYSSRNSYSATNVTGGIAMWDGGMQTRPGEYEVVRVEDFDGFLSFIDPIPYGITLDGEGRLWVAGIDSTRRWVKAFTFSFGQYAEEEYDLPSQMSADFPDPAGAPMGSPCDVAVTADGQTAYVIDLYGRTAFKFEYGASAVNDGSERAEEFALEQNYPNPFNPATMIRFTLPRASHITLTVSDALGRQVATLVDGRLSAGKHTKTFTASDLASGVYVYTLQTDANRISKKMLLAK